MSGYFTKNTNVNMLVALGDKVAGLVGRLGRIYSLGIMKVTKKNVLNPANVCVHAG